MIILFVAVLPATSLSISTAKCFAYKQGCQMVIFKPEIPIWANFGGLRWENVAILYGYLEYLTDIWDILRRFGAFCFGLVHFSGFDRMHQENLAIMFTRNAPDSDPYYLIFGI
jgi:hypothetical protein